MYIPPFIAGILVTLFAELVLIVAAASVYSRRR